MECDDFIKANTSLCWWLIISIQYFPPPALPVCLVSARLCIATFIAACPADSLLLTGEGLQPCPARFL